MAYTDPRTLERARKLRREMTEPEKRLWMRLRDRRLQGLKFNKQAPVGPFIVDFLCKDQALVVEVDGGTHSTEEELARDARRERFLTAQGLRVLRVTNEDVLKRMDDTLETVLGVANMGDFE
jgi:very-short-patch-repair endonuclease